MRVYVYACVRVRVFVCVWCVCGVCVCGVCVCMYGVYVHMQFDLKSYSTYKITTTAHINYLYRVQTVQ